MASRAAIEYSGYTRRTTDMEVFLGNVLIQTKNTIQLRVFFMQTNKGS